MYKMKQLEQSIIASYFIGKIDNESYFSSIEVTSVVDEPTLDSLSALTICMCSICSLVAGLLVNNKIRSILEAKIRNSVNTSINRIYLNHTKFNMATHTILLIYSPLKALFFPLERYISQVGCIVFPLLLDFYARMMPCVIPVAVALIRFILVESPIGIDRERVTKMHNIVVYGSYIVPATMVFFMQLPLNEFNQASYFVCMGRFEVYFNPLHPDPDSPGLRTGNELCRENYDKAWANDVLLGEFLVRMFVYWGCQISKVLFLTIMTGIPEALLYARLFQTIRKHNVRLESLKILKPEYLRQRAQQNSVNMSATAFAWVVEIISNAFTIFFVKAVYGKGLFLHSLMSIFHLFNNFVIVPLLFVVVADPEIQKQVLKGKLKQAFQLLYQQNL